MTTTIEVHEKTDVILPPRDGGSQSASAVSWGAIFAGAAGAAALSLILLILGTGLGFSSISPWAGDGVSAKTFGITGILWITLTSLAASGMGGYLAGRLRTRWAATNSDEVYFRDTAHGFLAWAIATLFTAALLTSSIAAIVGGAVKTGASVAQGVATSAAVAGVAASDRFGLEGESTNYFIDSLFRKPSASNSTNTGSPDTGSTTNESNSGSTEVPPGIPPTAPAPTMPTDSTNTYANNTSESRPANVPAAEVARIFVNAMRTGALPEGDAQYLGQVVADRTDLSQQEAEQRVKDTYAQWQTQVREAETAAKEAADEARKATAYLSLWFFVALLVGAFTASWLATFGGRQRDL